METLSIIIIITNFKERSSCTAVWLIIGGRGQPGSGLLLDDLAVRLARGCDRESVEGEVVAGPRRRRLLRRRHDVLLHELLHLLDRHAVRLQRQAGAQLLVGGGVRHAHHHGVSDPGARPDALLQPPGVEDVRPAHDGVAAPPLHDHMTPIVQSPDVPGAEEAVAGEGGGRGFGVVQVLLHHDRPLEEDLPGLTRGQRGVLLVVVIAVPAAHNPHLRPLHRVARVEVPVGVRVTDQQGRHREALRRSVEDEDRARQETSRAHEGPRDGLAAQRDPLQDLQGVALGAGVPGTPFAQRRAPPLADSAQQGVQARRWDEG